MKPTNLTLLSLILAAGLSHGCNKLDNNQANRVKGNKPLNVVFILTDDHRYDFMGFTGKIPWLETPGLDSLASKGVYFPNAFVTTSLCSPSRATILTGMYSHTHQVVDNASPIPDGLTFFSEYLQDAGYQTAFLGKWHIGEETDDPQPGFDHWVSFKGQGVYFNPVLNIDGQITSFVDSAYITDVLTDLSIDWLENQDPDIPFFLYLSHKAVHEDFYPAPRHKMRYEKDSILLPASFYSSAPKIRGKVPMGEKPLDGHEYYGENRVPDWQKLQRESVHGVDYILEGERTFEDVYKRYCEALLGVDESVGRILSYLENKGLAESTLLIYMGDNGFSFGEHGLIDKRQFYEESAKVPLLVSCPELFRGGKENLNLVQNIDLAPTFLDAAGLQPGKGMQGSSILPLLTGEASVWRDRIYYEYYWEYEYPYTPTMHGVRTDRYKLIRYQGIWDTDEFYDIESDPFEINNLIASPSHQAIIRELTGDIYTWLESTGGMQIPLKRTVRPKLDHRNKGIY